MKPSNKWSVQAQLKALVAITSKSFPQFRDKNDSVRYQELENSMTKIYSTTTVMNPSCSKELSLDPHMIASFQKLATEKNSKKSWHYQKYLWEAWHDSIGGRIKPLYSEFVDLGNKAASNQGFSDVGEIWRKQYGILNLEGVIDKLWIEIKPLYQLLHGFVRHRLSLHYGPDIVDPNLEPMPSNIFGNVWGQTWDSLLPLVAPYPNILRQVYRLITCSLIGYQAMCKL